jgi:Ser/Thr protein kinase RdoA (MazF antagonist)
MHNHEFDEQQGPIMSEDLLDLNEIMRAFGINAWQNLGPVLPAHSEGLNLLVEAEGQHYVLRERPEGMVGEDLTHRYAFQRYLQQEGIPIPALRLTPAGEAVVTIGEDFFELQQWVDGSLFSTSDPHSLAWVEAAGAMLGRIHQASSRYSGHRHHWPAEVHMGAMVQNWLNLARSKAETSEIQAVTAGLSNWIDQWEAVLPSAMVSIGAGGSLPEFHIHGDYHALNLRFDPSSVVAVTGLEASHWEKRLFEVAYALFYFSALKWEPEEHLTRPLVKRGFEPERARHFMQSYGELCPPMPGEADLLPEALMLIAPIATINGPLEDLFYAQEELDAALIDDVMERIAWAASLPAWLRRVGGALSEMWAKER